ncbi:MAG: hypothetical protein IJ099_07355 [Alphaproteobacteria bacterium]|nr:hypothetical protein [Alphaproteobacteria bacterium]
MVEVISEKKQKIDGDCYFVTQELSDGSRREINRDGDKIFKTKTIQKDGSYIEVNENNVKIEELTSDGYLRKYNPQTKKLAEETSPDKVVTKFYENGNKQSVRDEQNGLYTSYYENGNLARHEDTKKNYEINKNANGRVNYELEDGKLTINPDYFSYYCLGVKSQNNDEHWEEKCTLNPKKKTLLCLGGDQTKDARAANGNTNAFAAVLGLSPEEKDNIQLVSSYRPFNENLRWIWYKVEGFDKQLEIDYKREVLQKFMPFMAHEVDGKFERLTPKELTENFANIMIQAHCYGANDLPRINKVFREMMTKLGYSEELQKNALQQIICVTNNSQREMTDNLDFSCIHRYSVTDGQFEPEYNTDESAEYPVFVQDYQAFVDKKGNQAAFIATKPNEVIMVYDKVLRVDSKKDEHNHAFWIPEESLLTEVGKYQARLMAKIGQAWYDNKSEMSDIVTFLQKITDKSTLHPFVTKALAFGKKLKAEKKNALINHHILKSAWNKFKNPNSEIAKTGVYKLLSDKYRE